MRQNVFGTLPEGVLDALSAEGGLVTHGAFSDARDFTVVAGEVTEWANRGSEGDFLGPVGLRGTPSTLLAHPAVGFTDIPLPQQLLKAPAFDATPYTDAILTIVYQDTEPPTSAGYVGGFGETGQNGSLYIIVNSGGVDRVSANWISSLGVGFGAHATGFDSAVPLVVTAIIRSGATPLLRLRINGVEVASATLGVPDLGTLGNLVPAMGSRPLSGGFSWSGVISDFVFAVGSSSVAAAEQVEQLLIRERGITP